MPRLVAAPDKFRGTAGARDVADAICRAGKRAGWRCDAVPMADGGEGILEAVGGTVRRTRVRGPLGETVEAEWRLKGTTAVIETAQAAGLELVGGGEWNDPMRASTAGVGDLISAALAAGAKRVIVGVGGSATTDGGLACLTALEPHARLSGVDLVVACDVTTTFVDAAEHFAPQKGATPAQVALLRRRLERLAQVYEEDFGIDVRSLPGSGAAGGLAGGLAALGATLVPGFDLVADTVGLGEKLEGADLAVTGEGFLDEQSFRGKVVGGVAEFADDLGVPLLIVVGQVYGEHDVPGQATVVSLVERYGEDRARNDTAACIDDAVSAFLAGSVDNEGAP
ncbi:MAG: glycerate 2-kinase [Acidimicrobiaceae bacterium]|nr:glycerate 2-kinase [Acidimicrobiaceae bacterium]